MAPIVGTMTCCQMLATGDFHRYKMVMIQHANCTATRWLCINMPITEDITFGGLQHSSPIAESSQQHDLMQFVLCVQVLCSNSGSSLGYGFPTVDLDDEDFFSLQASAAGASDIVPPMPKAFTDAIS